MERRKAERLKQRLTCELVIADRCHAGIVVDISRTGLFVETSVSPPPGEKVRVKLRPSDGADVEVEASVARRYLVPRRLESVARGGIGLRIESASDDYLELTRGVRPGEETPPPDAPINAFPSVMRCRERLHPKAVTDAPPVPSEGTAYRVRARQTSGTLSRSFQVTAPSEEEAKLMASTRLDEDWEILDVDPVQG